MQNLMERKGPPNLTNALRLPEQNQDQEHTKLVQNLDNTTETYIHSKIASLEDQESSE